VDVKGEVKEHYRYA